MCHMPARPTDPRSLLLTFPVAVPALDPALRLGHVGLAVAELPPAALPVAGAAIVISHDTPPLPGNRTAPLLGSARLASGRETPWDRPGRPELSHLSHCPTTAPDQGKQVGHDQLLTVSPKRDQGEPGRAPLSSCLTVSGELEAVERSDGHRRTNPRRGLRTARRAGGTRPCPPQGRGCRDAETLGGAMPRTPPMFQHLGALQSQCVPTAPMSGAFVQVRRVP